MSMRHSIIPSQLPPALAFVIPNPPYYPMCHVQPQHRTVLRFVRTLRNFLLTLGPNHHLRQLVVGQATYRRYYCQCIQLPRLRSPLLEGSLSHKGPLLMLSASGLRQS